MPVEACLGRTLNFGQDFEVDLKHPCMLFIQGKDQ
jgi:hypothetical protein